MDDGDTAPQEGRAADAAGFPARSADGRQAISLGDIDRAVRELVDGPGGSGSELERRLAAAKRSVADEGRAMRASRSELYGEHSAELLDLAGAIACMVPVADDGGYLSPKNAFDIKLESGAYEGDRAALLGARWAAERLARAWNGERALTGVQLACNALLLAVMENAAIRETAFRRARSWAEGLRRELEECGADLLLTDI